MVCVFYYNLRERKGRGGREKVPNIKLVGGISEPQFGPAFVTVICSQQELLLK